MVNEHQETYIIRIMSLENFAATKVVVQDNSLNQLSNIPHVIRCRELIFSEPNILAFPASNSRLREFYIISSNSESVINKLQNRLKNLNVEFSDPKEVDPHLLENSFIYTLQAKLAPLWNKVGNHLLKGRDFLTTERAQSSIDIKAAYFNGKISLTVTGRVINFPKLELSELGVGKAYITEFNEFPRAVIPEHIIQNRWCFILPTMRKGQICAIRKSLPPDCPFPSYLTLRRHWKNHYGYRLPEKEEDVFFVQVYFKPIGQILFTYPSCCIRLSRPEYIEDLSVRLVPREFLEDVVTTVPTLLTGTLLFCDKIGIDAMESRKNPVGEPSSNEKQREEKSKYFPFASQPMIPIPPSFPKNVGTRLSSSVIMKKWLSGDTSASQPGRIEKAPDKLPETKQTANNQELHRNTLPLLSKFHIPRQYSTLLDVGGRICKKRHLGMTRSIISRNIQQSQPMTQYVEDPEVVVKMRKKMTEDEKELHVVEGNISKEDNGAGPANGIEVELEP